MRAGAVSAALMETRQRQPGTRVKIKSAPTEGGSARATRWHDSCLHKMYRQCAQAAVLNGDVFSYRQVNAPSIRAGDYGLTGLQPLAFAAQKFRQPIQWRAWIGTRVMALKQSYLAGCAGDPDRQIAGSTRLSGIMLLLI